MAGHDLLSVGGVLYGGRLTIVSALQVWVSVRGEDYIQVLDGSTYQPTRRVKVGLHSSSNQCSSCRACCFANTCVQQAAFAVPGTVNVAALQLQVLVCQRKRAGAESFRARVLRHLVFSFCC